MNGIMKLNEYDQRERMVERVREVLRTKKKPKRKNRIEYQWIFYEVKEKKNSERKGKE